jgi:NAD(P)-dependent dehydrogenase (short-subunit alcohol dehydrogenase family)
MHFADLHGRRSYSRWPASGQSKLANLLFTYEFARRLTSRGAETLSAGCHPGYADTNLQTAGFRMEGARVMERAAHIANRIFSQTVEMGALPTLYAATAEDVRSGDYIGPSQTFASWGPPVKLASNARTPHTADAARLWAVSEELTGVRFNDLDA